MNLPLSLSTANLSAKVSFLPREITFASLKKHHVIFITEIVAFTLVGLILAFGLKVSVNSLLVKPNLNTQDLAGTSAVPVTKSLVFSFDRPFSRKVSLDITPKVLGTWEFKKPLVFDRLYQEIVFNPETSLEPNTVYTVNIKNLNSILAVNQPSNLTYSFKTKAMPKIVKTDPTTNTVEVKPNQVLAVHLDSPNENLALFKFSFEPKVDFSTSLSNDQKTYFLKPTASLKQDTKYQVVMQKFTAKFNPKTNGLISVGSLVDNQVVNFATISSPTVSFSTKSSSASTGPITIAFSKDIDNLSVVKNLSFNPDFPKTISWADKKTLIVTPTPNLMFNTVYTINLASPTFATDGSYTTSQISNQFTTLGNVKASFSPGNGSRGVALKANVVVYFDQPVDHASAESRFALVPNVTGSFSWNGNNLTFIPNELKSSTNYKITLSSGVKSLTALDSTTSFTSQFTTLDIIERVLLNVPNYKQKYSLSCEFANIRMVLAYRGINKTEDELIAETPFDNTPKSGETWGDPYAGFVGNVKGTYFVDGYGAYYPVIVNEVSKYRTAESHVGWNLSSMLNEVKSGNPVIIWSCLICDYPRYWNTPAGKQIYAYQYYHMLTVVGYTGSPDNPLTITMNDSVYGRQLTWSKSQFLAKWATMNNTAVVVK